MCPWVSCDLEQLPPWLAWTEAAALVLWTLLLPLCSLLQLAYVHGLRSTLLQVCTLICTNTQCM